MAGKTRARTYKPRSGNRKRRVLRVVRNRRTARGLVNMFKYKRFCADSTLANSEQGVVKWVQAQSGWDLGSATPDDNGLYQFGGVMKFQLDDVINPTDFTTLYDRYKITGVKLTFIPLSNQGYAGASSTGNQSSATLATMAYSIDYDDSSIPASSLEILEKMDCRIKRLDKPVSIYIKSPKVSTTVNSESGNVSAGIGATGYFNCANDDINFRGLKFYIRDMPLPDATKDMNSLIRVQAKYYLAFKDPQ